MEDQAAAAAASAAQEYVARSASGSSPPSSDATTAPPPLEHSAASSASLDAGTESSRQAAGSEAPEADSAVAATTVSGSSGGPQSTGGVGDGWEADSDAGAVASRAKNFGGGKPPTKSAVGGSSAGSTAASSTRSPAEGAEKRGGGATSAGAEVADIDGGSWVPRRERTADGRPRFNFAGLKKLAEVPPTPTVADLEAMLGLKPPPAPPGMPPAGTEAPPMVQAVTGAEPNDTPSGASAEGPSAEKLPAGDGDTA